MPSWYSKISSHIKEKTLDLCLSFSLSMSNYWKACCLSSLHVIQEGSWLHFENTIKSFLVYELLNFSCKMQNTSTSCTANQCPGKGWSIYLKSNEPLRSWDFVVAQARSQMPEAAWWNSWTDSRCSCSLQTCNHHTLSGAYTCIVNEYLKSVA